MAGLADGLRQLLSLSEAERRAALSALSTSHPNAKAGSPSHSESTGSYAYTGEETIDSGSDTPGQWPHAGSLAAQTACPPGLAPGSGHARPLAPGLYQSLGAPSSSGELPMPRKVPLPERSDCGFGAPTAGSGSAWQSPIGETRRLGEAEELSTDELIQRMSKVFLSSLIGSMPAQADPRNQRMQNMQWLREQLERQQEESIVRLSRMVQSQQAQQTSDAWATGHRGTHTLRQPAQPAQPAQQHATPDALVAALRSSMGQQGWGRGASANVAQKLMPQAPLPGWDPQLALAAAEAAGMLPGQPASQEAQWSPPPPRKSQQRNYVEASQEVQRSLPPPRKSQQRNHVEPPTPTTLASNKTDTLRAHLRALQNVDPRRVVLVRKISKLGFDSGAVLEAHYSKYGRVENVMVAHSHIKPQSKGLSIRLRPSGLGFVVMERIADAEAILDAGDTQVVNGVQVVARPYEVRSAKDQEDSFMEDDNIMGA